MAESIMYNFLPLESNHLLFFQSGMAPGYPSQYPMQSGPGNGGNYPHPQAMHMYRHNSQFNQMMPNNCFPPGQHPASMPYMGGRQMYGPQHGYSQHPYPMQVRQQPGNELSIK